MNFNIFNLYVIKNLSLVTAFIAVTLAAIILMTQSLKFLELIINSGASSSAFWQLAFLALPRFFEIILPIALMIGSIFVYNRMTSDSEVIVMRAAGVSPLSMGKPALIVALIISILVLFISAWLAPVALSKMQKMRQIVKTEYSTLLFQAGVFTEVGDSLTIYIDRRNAKGELEGLIIHDSREENPAPVTILAQKGIVVATDDGQQVLVYDGSRQDFNKKNGVLNRLDFKRYSIDLPDTEAVRTRWKEPDERTFLELLNPNENNADDVRYAQEFIVEAHRRIASALLSLSYVGIVLCFLLLGPLNRYGQSRRIMLAIVFTIIIQSLFLSLSSFAVQNMVGVILMYAISIIPFCLSIFALSAAGETVRRDILFKKKVEDSATVAS